MKLIEKNNKKGITLIALVITIIVLLILAGVSIAMLTGDNSLLGNAKKTGPANNIGAAKDEVGLAYNTAMQEYYEEKYASTNGGNTTFASKLEEAIKKVAEDSGKNHGCGIVYDKDAGKITITNGGYKVIGTVDTADDSAGISWEEMKEENGIDITPANGQVVGYDDIVKNQKDYYGKVVKNYTLTDKTADGEDYIFRIFYAGSDIDGEERIYLKADPCDDRTLPTTTTYDAMSADGQTILKNQNPQWADKKLTSTWNDNEKATAWLCEPNNFTKTYKTTGELASKVNYVIGAPGIEMYVKSYNQTHPGGYTHGSTTYGLLKATYTSGDYGYKYAFGTKSASNYTAANSIDNSGFRQMYCKYMWLASPSAYGGSNVCRVRGDVAALYFDDYYFTNSLAPLVSLSSDVQLQI